MATRTSHLVRLLVALVALVAAMAALLLAYSASPARAALDSCTTIGDTTTCTFLPSGSEDTSAGGSSLQYDASLDQYTYVWKTNKAWAGTCRQLVVKLDDGTYHRANFQFVK